MRFWPLGYIVYSLRLTTTCYATKVTRGKNFGNISQQKLNEMLDKDEDSCASTAVGSGSKSIELLLLSFHLVKSSGHDYDYD